LRREEVAALAGISTAYYTKLEQGRAGRIPAEVVRAVGDALELGDLDRLHFRALVKNASGRPMARPVAGPVARPAKVRPALIAMMNALDAPALLHGPRLDVLATNDLAKVAIDDFDRLPIKDRNLARWTFLDPRARIVHPDWRQIAPQVAAALRRLTAGRPADPRLERLVGEVLLAAPEFARYWAEYRLYLHPRGTRRFFHEAVGEFTLHYETLTLPKDDQSLLVYTAERGSPAQEKLRLLAGWTAPVAGTPAT
jgi:transcriptional regulator with XRE-family HTH domain